jgi:hypothetical protein
MEQPTVKCDGVPRAALRFALGFLIMPLWGWGMNGSSNEIQIAPCPNRKVITQGINPGPAPEFSPFIVRLDRILGQNRACCNHIGIRK